MTSGQVEGDLPVADERLESSVGQYRIVRRIGQGGMGIVYEAVHRAIGQRAAIKVLASASARRSNYFERFANEARAASAVSHPGLVKVFDFGRLADGTPFILMEYLEGEVLRARMERLRKLPLDMAVQIIRQIASALAAVHGAGIVHRDVKPENVVLVPDDASDAGERPKLLDFGVARLDSGSSSLLTDPGMVIGTPVYMSPEQCSGGTIDWASDVYSLGVLACEMLTGQLPHAMQAEPARQMQAHIDQPPRPGTLDGVPQPVASLIFRMLSKQSWHRPTAAVVANELQMPRSGAVPFVLASTLVNEAGTPAARPAEGGGGRGRSRRWWIGAALLASVLAGLGAAKLGLSLRERHAPEVAPVQLAGMVRLAGGKFTMGLTPEQVEVEIKAACAKDPDCRPDFFQRQQPARQVTLSPFYLDEHEVTNQELVDWLNTSPDMWMILPNQGQMRLLRERASGEVMLDLHPARGGVLLADSQANQFMVKDGQARRPGVQLTWNGARAYCAMHGKRLPTEAEWEFAARGVTGRTYPWGDKSPGCDGVVFGRNPEGLCAGRPLEAVDAGSSPQDVTPEGVHDLGGNVSEWVADAFKLPFYPACGECMNPRLDSKDEPDSTYRVFRGAGFDMAVTLQTTRRGRWIETSPATSIGFRCAADAPK